MIICICGIKGKMASKVKKALEKKFKIVGIDKESDDFVYKDYLECFKRHKVDVVVDFSAKKASQNVIKYALNNNIKVISGTTDFDEDDLKTFTKLATDNQTSLVISANFSKGISLFYDVINILNKEYPDKYLFEAHQITKHDKPSGTARVISQKLGIKTDEISSLRMPNQNALHEVYFINDFEKITVKHEILDYNAFINGFLMSFYDFIEGDFTLNLS